MPSFGCLPSPPDPRDARYHFDGLPVPRAVPLPVTAPVPPGGAWDQGMEGTCVAHAVGLAAVVAIYVKTGRWIISSATAGHRLARDLYHLANPTDTTYQQGTWPRAALEAARIYGVLGADNRRHKISSYHALTPSADIRSAIESAIANRMIVITAWQWHQSWCSYSYPFDTLPEPSGSIAGGHAVGVWRAVMKHPYAGSTVLRRDHDLQNSWGPTYAGDGRVYFNAADEVATGDLWEAWVCQG